MPRPARGEQFLASEVGIVHCVQRCVRRAFLAGVDSVSGKNYDFRREWIRKRMELLASVFGIDVLTYAILSNHLHIVIRNRPDVVATWSDKELAVRWLRIFPGRRIDEQLAQPTSSDVDMLVNNQDRLAIIKLRMSDPSWFMRALCEPIARMANAHDECTGRFWEGRFKAQRIADEAGLLACSMYVDLNPIRAAMAESPEDSVHTSAYDRIRSLKGIEIESAASDLEIISNDEAGKLIRSTPVKELKAKRLAKRKKGSIGKILSDAWLCPLTLDERAGSHTGVKGSVQVKLGVGEIASEQSRRESTASNGGNSRSTHESPETNAIGLGVRASNNGFLPMTLLEYLSLLDWTGRQGRIDKRGKIPSNLQPILGRLGIDASMWCDLVWNFKKYFGRSSSAGTPKSLSEDATKRNKKWSRGQRAAAGCFVGCN